MSINWPTAQEDTVRAAIQKFHIRSGWCAPLARIIQEQGAVLDRESRILAVRPTDQQATILTKLGGRGFDHHFVASLLEHCCDALTGHPGHEIGGYLDTYWQYPDGICLEVASKDDDDLAAMFGDED